jgi:hypothetical protein
MGLDMFACKTKDALPGPVDFNVYEIEWERIFYWRKHPNLHGWMERLYREKGGAEDSFNMVPVQLNLVDLDALKLAVTRGSLPATQGFFFGQSHSTPEERQQDLDFIEVAIAAINEGYNVYYTSWW